MTRLLKALILGSCLSLSVAYADLPSEVIQAYKSYNQALSAQDYDSAMRHGKAAWKRAESSLGDHKTTGDLAYNYGMLAAARGNVQEAETAIKRGFELANLHDTNGFQYRLERGVELINFHQTTGDSRRADRLIDDLLDEAQGQAVSQSVFYGELLTQKASICTAKANRASTRTQITRHTRFNSGDKTAERIQKDCAERAQQAVTIFENNQTLVRPMYVAHAYNVLGQNYERQEEWVDAALAYQKGKLAIEPVLGERAPQSLTLTGRWLNSINHLRARGRYDTAVAQGLCMTCWPFSTSENKVKLIEKSKTKRRLVGATDYQTSGYVILEGDVSDRGDVTNVRTLQSWPANQYVDYATRDFKQFKFSPKTGTEPDGYRENIVRVFLFSFLRNYNADDPQ